LELLLYSSWRKSSYWLCSLLRSKSCDVELYS